MGTFINPPPSVRLPLTIRRQITDRGLSIAALANATGIPRSTLSRHLTNGASLTVNELAAIAAALDFTPTELFRQAITASEHKAA